MNCICNDKRQIQPICEACKELNKELDSYETPAILDALRCTNPEDTELRFLLRETWLDGCRAFLRNGRTFTTGEWKAFIGLIKA
jgi:hypothetical protein